VAVFAGIAQLVEQLICNQQVVGSNPTAGSLVNRGLIPSERNSAWTVLRDSALLKDVKSLGSFTRMSPGDAISQASRKMPTLP
jgi:hypothetical protein